jgi:hypothetical protein
MSIEFLEAINGGADGRLRRFIELHRGGGSPRLAWYPSAGDDLRDLIYLSKEFAARNPGTLPDPAPPDLFVHTDGWLPSRFDAWGKRPAHRDSRTRITVLHRERLPDVSLPSFRDLIDERAPCSGRADFFELRVESQPNGVFPARLLYVEAENAAFCARYLLARRARVTHLVQVRYGQGEGGARTCGGWLERFTEALGTEVVVSDPRLGPGHGDAWRQERCFPELRGYQAPTTSTRPIRTMRGERWSGHGDITWWVRGATAPARTGSWVGLLSEDRARLETFAREHAIQGRLVTEHLVRHALEAGFLPGPAELEALRGKLI